MPKHDEVADKAGASIGFKLGWLYQTGLGPISEEAPDAHQCRSQMAKYFSDVLLAKLSPDPRCVLLKVEGKNGSRCR